MSNSCGEVTLSSVSEKITSLILIQSDHLKQTRLKEMMKIKRTRSNGQASKRFLGSYRQSKEVASKAKESLTRDMCFNSRMSTCSVLSRKPKLQSRNLANRLQTYELR